MWHQPCQCCKYTSLSVIQKHATKKLVIHVESHASAVSLLKSGEQCYIKAIDNKNDLTQLSVGSRAPLAPVTHFFFLNCIKARAIWSTITSVLQGLKSGPKVFKKSTDKALLNIAHNSDGITAEEQSVVDLCIKQSAIIQKLETFSEFAVHKVWTCWHKCLQRHFLKTHSEPILTCCRTC